MNEPASNPDCFRVDERLTLLPVVHGSGVYARAMEAWLLNRRLDCLAIPLPSSFQTLVVQGVHCLPTPSIVLQAPQRESTPQDEPRWTEPVFDDEDDPAEDRGLPAYSYVPVEPSQGVIAAIRFAVGERLPLEFIDLEVAEYEPEHSSLPDAFALREVSLETFATAILPTIGRPATEQSMDRVHYMAHRLKALTARYRQVVALCSMAHWPWLREAYRTASWKPPTPSQVASPEIFGVHEQQYLFLMGELPYLTGIFEESRYQLDRDPKTVPVDGVKRLLMAARASYHADFGKRGRRITPLLLSQCLKYIRNLTLLDRRLTPDLYTLAIAAKQVLGDQFAIHLIETARHYPFQEGLPWASIELGVDRARLPNQETVGIVNRLAGSEQEWRSIELNRKPLRHDKAKWEMRWNPYRQCSWPPEDDLIESFRSRVIERARQAMGADLARSEKFTTSLMDGLDIRETLRHWYDGDLYVKIQPPSVGHLDACVLLFEASPDPREYPWKTTWFAEHEDESTLAFFATDYRHELIGPGIAVANYGGALFLYPPRPIPDIWQNPGLDFADTLEERLIAAACLHAEAKQIAIMSPITVGAAWRRLAKRFGKSLVHVPLNHFNDEMIQQLRTVHVLNGQEVRSYAAHFIRQV